MYLSIRSGLLALFVIAAPIYAHACSTPNPNLNGPPFIDSCPVPAAALNRMSSQSGVFVSGYGADLTGVNDSTAAVNSCLAAAGRGGVCKVDVGAKLRLLGQLTNFGNQSTLDCQVYAAPGLDMPVSTLTGPRLQLGINGTLTMSATAVGPTIQNCVIVPDGMGFPQGGSSAWTGTAINTNGAIAPQLINLTIAGFDTCINTTTNGGSLRPLLRRIYADCNGLINGGSVITGNNGDFAILEDVALQVLATSSANCNRVRQGTGLLVTGSVWGSRLIAQDFLIADFNFNNTGGVLIGDMWTDDTANLLGCSFPADKGLIINNVADIDIKHLDLNANFTGVLISNQGINQNVHIHDAWLNGIRGDAFDLGATSGTVAQEEAGVVQIDMLRTNQTGANVAGFAVNILDPNNGTSLILNGGQLLTVHGNAAPYIKVPSTSDAAHIKISSSVLSDLPNSGVALYGTTSVGSCTGLGTGTCSIQAAFRQSPWTGLISLSPTGSPANLGAFTITWPIATSFMSCTASYAGGTWGAGLLPITAVATNATSSTFNWAQTAALTAGNTYGITFVCDPN